MSKIKKDETIERKIEAVCIPCPDPFILDINSKNSYYDPSEFNTNHLALPNDQFNFNQTNKFFLHTYVWKPKHRCCQVLKAHIQVKMTSLTASKSPKHPNAGNDGISLVMNGGASIISEPVYPPAIFPFLKGKEVVKDYVLTGSQLDWLNSANRLSFFVQDDTSVNWIKIRLEICCLKKKKVRIGQEEA